MGVAWEGEGPSPGSQCHKQTFGGGALFFHWNFPFLPFLFPFFLVFHIYLLLFSPGRGEEGGAGNRETPKMGILASPPPPPSKNWGDPQMGGEGRK